MTHMHKILLINTSYPVKSIKMYNEYNPPFGLLSIASPLIHSGFDINLIDPQIEDDYMEKIELMISEKPLFVGMTIFIGPNIINAIELSKHIKKLSPETPIVWGGPMATSSPELCLRNAPADYIVMGMGEETVVNLANTIKEKEDPSTLSNVSYCAGDKIVTKEIYSFNGYIGKLDYPQLGLWGSGIRKIKRIPILSSRGCPRNCAFCYNNTFTGRKKWYGRSGQDVIEEMDNWAKYFNMNKFYFIDDNFLVNTQRACYVLEKSIERKYQISNFIGHLHDFKPEVLKLISGYIDKVGFSIESASPKIQKLLNKIVNLKNAFNLITYLSENGVEIITTNFMFGLPTETDEDIGANINMAVKIRNISNKARIIPYIYTPQPKDDIISKFDFYEKINFSIENLSTIDMSPNRSGILSHEIRPWMSKEDIRFYLDLVLVWFYHFDNVVRGAQAIDIEGIYKKNMRLARLFKEVPMP